MERFPPVNGSNIAGEIVEGILETEEDEYLEPRTRTRLRNIHKASAKQLFE